MTFVTLLIDKLQDFVYSQYTNTISRSFIAGFLTMIGICLMFSFVSGILIVFIAPSARGSGIPEVKTYLNGTHINHLFSFMTLICKLVGVSFAVGGNFVVGKEGPMVHAGSAIANAIGSLGILCNFDICLGYVFGSDEDKRDLITCGCAAGVSAAFGAPVGGMLFALEEVSSFWNRGLNWRAFFWFVMFCFKNLFVV